MSAALPAAGRTRAQNGPPPGTRVLRIALAGCGVVGGELVRLIRTCGPAIEAGQLVRLEIVSVLVRDPRKERGVPLDPALYTRDVDTFLRAPADVVVEAMGGLDPAERIARAALGRGARFVTANKALVGIVGNDLAALARECAGALDFEAAVGGGILSYPDRLIRDAEAVGSAVRLVAECALEAGSAAASVEPVIVPSDGELGRTVEEQNHISVDVGWSRPVSLSGPGAGGLPTASALLRDILRSCALHPVPGYRAVTPCEWTRIREVARGLKVAGRRPLITRLAPELDPGAVRVDTPALWDFLARPGVGA